MRKGILAQAFPDATTDTEIYIAPSEVVISSLCVCNQGGSDATFRLAVKPADDTLSNQHYIYYDVTVPANDTFTATIGLTLGNDDIVIAYVSANTISFNLFGQES